MKTLVTIAKGVFSLVRFGVTLLATLLRQRLTRRRGSEAPAGPDVTPKPLPA